MLPTVAAAQSNESIEGLHQQARSAVARGTPLDLTEALRIWARARQLAHEQRDLVTESAILNNMGVTRIKLGHPDTAVAEFRQAMQVATLADHASNQMSALYNLGRTFESLGRSDEALMSYRAALEVLERLPERVEIRSNIESRITRLQERFDDADPAE